MKPLLSLLLKLSLLMSLFLFSGISYGKIARTVRMTDTQMEKIMLFPGRTTILSFPTKPTKVLLGNQGLFAVEYIENDIAIAPLLPNARSNLFTYLEGRRFAFDLSTVNQPGDDIVLVRDAVDGNTSK